MQQLFFQIETDYRAELKKLGRDIPAVADVCVDFTLLSSPQHQAIRHLLRIENKFLDYDRSDGVPAHDARTLLMALTREAWCDPHSLGRAWMPPPRTLVAATTNRLHSETPPPYFSPAEVRGLHLAYTAHASTVNRLVVDVDERVLLLLALERAEQLDALSPSVGFHLPTLLDKLVALTLPEADSLWTALQTTSAPHLTSSAASLPGLGSAAVNLSAGQPPVMVRR